MFGMALSMLLVMMGPDVGAPTRVADDADHADAGGNCGADGETGGSDDGGCTKSGCSVVPGTGDGGWAVPLFLVLAAAIVPPPCRRRRNSSC
jgi:hypothetical protein